MGFPAYNPNDNKCRNAESAFHFNLLGESS